jgi:hypothetical protein
VGSSRALTGSAGRLYARHLRDAKEPECAVLWHYTALGGRARKWQAHRLESAARSARRREDTAWTPLLRQHLAAARLRPLPAAAVGAGGLPAPDAHARGGPAGPICVARLDGADAPGPVAGRPSRRPGRRAIPPGQPDPFASSRWRASHPPCRWSKLRPVRQAPALAWSKCVPRPALGASCRARHASTVAAMDARRDPTCHCGQLRVVTPESRSRSRSATALLASAAQAARSGCRPGAGPRRYR